MSNNGAGATPRSEGNVKGRGSRNGRGGRGGKGGKGGSGSSSRADAPSPNEWEYRVFFNGSVKAELKDQDGNVVRTVQRSSFAEVRDTIKETDPTARLKNLDLAEAIIASDARQQIFEANKDIEDRLRREAEDNFQQDETTKRVQEHFKAFATSPTSQGLMPIGYDFHRYASTAGDNRATSKIEPEEFRLWYKFDQSYYGADARFGVFNEAAKRVIDQEISKFESPITDPVIASNSVFGREDYRIASAKDSMATALTGRLGIAPIDVVNYINQSRPDLFTPPLTVDQYKNWGNERRDLRIPGVTNFPEFTTKGYNDFF